MNDLKPGTRVIAALSGGVDSAVAMALAKDAGLDVIGVTLQLWDYSDSNKFGTCCASRDVADARNVCDELDIPFYVIDSQKVFKEKVVDYFKAEYEAGRTPSPCVLCNSKVKFQIIDSIADDLKAKAIITGHYTRTILNGDGNIEIFRGEDKLKDQSYFMFGLEQKVLNKLRAPLGSADKNHVRHLARKYGLTRVSEKPDSQDLCFLGTDKPQDFIRKTYKKKFEPAKVLDIRTGEFLGMHSGVANATIGQRKGLHIAAGEKLYVVRIDSDKNIIYMGEDKDLFHDELRVYWVKAPSHDGVYDTKIRYRHEGSPATVSVSGSIKFSEKQRAITPGQAAVCYDQADRLVAGGFIL